jgi:ubiquinone/menaquinone biosynthesis C-methylase UbiE
MSQTIQTSDRIQDALYGFARSQLLFTAIDLDVFTAIHEGHDTLELLISRVNADPRALRIFLDGLVGIGFLEKHEQRYQLPEDIHQYLIQGSPAYMGGMVQHGKRLYENWMLLTDVVRSGQPAGGAQSLADIEAYFAELVQGLYVSNYPTAKKLARALLQNGDANLSVLDVAGGSGVWSIALLEQEPGSRATVLDYPTVVEITEGYVRQHGLEARYDYLPGDLELLDFPEARFDLAILGNICHAIGPYSSQKLLQNVALSLKPGGRIAIVDFLPDDERSRPGWPLIFGVNMLICTPDGDVFTLKQYRQWLEEAGFTDIRREELDQDVTLVTAVKAAK